MFFSYFVYSGISLAEKKISDVASPDLKEDAAVPVVVALAPGENNAAVDNEKDEVFDVEEELLEEDLPDGKKEEDDGKEKEASDIEEIDDEDLLVDVKQDAAGKLLQEFFFIRKLFRGLGLNFLKNFGHFRAKTF